MPSLQPALLASKLSDSAMRAVCATPDGGGEAESVSRGVLLSADALPSVYERERATFDGVNGDRRQEIVFIGTGLAEGEARIRGALDACLLSDEELEHYRERWAGFEPSVEAWRGAEHLRRVALV